LFFADHDTFCQDRNVLQHFLSAVTETWSLHSSHFQCATQFVYNQCCHGFPFKIFRDDQQRSTLLSNFFEDMEDVFHRGDLLVVDQDERVGQLTFHFVCVGNEVWRDIPSVKLHTFYDINGSFCTLCLFNCDHTVFTYFLHGFCDQLSDLSVIIGRNGSHLLDLLDITSNSL